MAHFVTISENGCFKLQSAQGRFFDKNEYVLWDSYLRDFLRDSQGGVFVFSKEEAEAHMKDSELLLEQKDV